MTAEENIASLALFVRPRIHEIMNRWWILESLKSIRNQRHDLSFLLNLYNVQKILIKSRNIFQNDDVYETVETESGSEISVRPTHLLFLSEKRSVNENCQRKPGREGGPGGLVTFTFSQPSEEPCALQQQAITLSKYFWLSGRQRNTRIPTSSAN